MGFFDDVSNDSGDDEFGFSSDSDEGYASQSDSSSDESGYESDNLDTFTVPTQPISLPPQQQLDRVPTLPNTQQQFVPSVVNRVPILPNVQQQQFTPSVVNRVPTLPNTQQQYNVPPQLPTVQQQYNAPSQQQFVPSVVNRVPILPNVQQQFVPSVVNRVPILPNVPPQQQFIPSVGVNRVPISPNVQQQFVPSVGVNRVPILPNTQQQQFNMPVVEQHKGYILVDVFSPVGLRRREGAKSQVYEVEEVIAYPEEEQVLFNVPKKKKLSYNRELDEAFKLKHGNVSTNVLDRLSRCYVNSIMTGCQYMNEIQAFV